MNGIAVQRLHYDLENPELVYTVWIEQSQGSGGVVYFHPKPIRARVLSSDTVFSLCVLFCFVINEPVKV
jgi:hypothetical protein